MYGKKRTVLSSEKKSKLMDWEKESEKQELIHWGCERKLCVLPNT